MEKNLLASLKRLAKIIPFAPDFNDRETAEAFCSVLARKNFSDETWSKVFEKAASTCERFPSPAELISIAVGASTVSARSIATTQAEGIWVMLNHISVYYEAQRFWEALSPAQRVAIPSPDFARSLADVKMDDRTTLVAQWRDAISGYIESNPEHPTVVQLRAKQAQKELPISSTHKKAELYAAG